MIYNDLHSMVNHLKSIYNPFTIHLQPFINNRQRFTILRHSIYNDLQPSTTIYNLSTTIYNHLQSTENPFTMIYNPSTTIYNHLQPFTTIYNPPTIHLQ
jgi:hypothetical protein